VSVQEFRDGQWGPSIPLPFYGLLHVRCDCGKRFWGRERDTARRYRDHYERVHIAGRGWFTQGRQWPDGPLEAPPGWQGQRIERVIGNGQISPLIGATDPYRGEVVPDAAPGCYWPIEDADQ
jgi:hypothetical protein